MGSALVARQARTNENKYAAPRRPPEGGVCQGGCRHPKSSAKKNSANHETPERHDSYNLVARPGDPCFGYIFALDAPRPAALSGNMYEHIR
jgi:hypothetical protein